MTRLLRVLPKERIPSSLRDVDRLERPLTLIVSNYCHKEREFAISKISRITSHLLDGRGNDEVGVASGHSSSGRDLRLDSRHDNARSLAAVEFEKGFDQWRCGVLGSPADLDLREGAVDGAETYSSFVPCRIRVVRVGVGSVYRGHWQDQPLPRIGRFQWRCVSFVRSAESMGVRLPVSWREVVVVDVS